MFDENGSRERERKIQSDFYHRNGRECLALFQAWEVEKERLGTNGADTDTEDALLRWIKKRVDPLVERVYGQRSDETNVSEDTFLIGWEEKAADIMLGVTKRLQTGKFKDHRNLLGYVFKSRQYAWTEFGRGVTRLIREGGRVPFLTINEDDEGETVLTETQPFDFDTLPMESPSAWVLCADYIAWLTATKQEFLLACRLAGPGGDTALRLTGLTQAAFEKRNQRIITDCLNVQSMLRAFSEQGEYFLHTRERLEGYVLVMSQMDRRRYPATLAEAKEEARKASPVPLQSAVQTADSLCVRKFLLTLWEQRNAV